jgi:hypothetical protein
MSGKAGVEFQADDNVLLYANVSRGVKSGGFTVYNSPAADQINAFKPETLWAYEAGFKGELAAQHRSLNGSVFYYDYRDQQVLGVVINPTNGAIGRHHQRPQVRDLRRRAGAAVDPVPRPADHPDGRLQEGQVLQDLRRRRRQHGGQDPRHRPVVGQTIDKSGQALDFPRISYGGTVSYTWAVGDFDVQAATDYAYRDKAKPRSWARNTRGLLLAGQRQPDDPAQGRAVGAGPVGRNIFNEKYDVTRNYFLPSAKIGAPGSRRPTASASATRSSQSWSPRSAAWPPEASMFKYEPLFGTFVMIKTLLLILGGLAGLVVVVGLVGWLPCAALTSPMISWKPSTRRRLRTTPTCPAACACTTRTRARPTARCWFWSTASVTPTSRGRAGSRDSAIATGSSPSTCPATA